MPFSQNLLAYSLQAGFSQHAPRRSEEDDVLLGGVVGAGVRRGQVLALWPQQVDRLAGRRLCGGAAVRQAGGV